jgi:glutamate racemase
MDTRPIGIFDSGVGGLSILRQIRSHLPNEDVLYVADQGHVPYGVRSLDEVRRFSHGITDFLLDSSAKLIVVACNTASAAALRTLRENYPDIPFVGMEPAVKPAAKSTRSHIVGVLATQATFQGELFASVVERFAQDVTILEQTLPNLVRQIENGDLDGPQTCEILREYVSPLIAKGADTLVLACTHYPFIIPVLKDLAGPKVQVIDPSPAIARQTMRVLERSKLNAPPNRIGRASYYSSGDPEHMRTMVERLLGEDTQIQPLGWSDDGQKLVPKP